MARYDCCMPLYPAPACTSLVPLRLCCGHSHRLVAFGYFSRPLASSLQRPGTLLHIATTVFTLSASPRRTQYVAGHSLAVTTTQKPRSQDSASGDLSDHSLSPLLLPGSRAGQGPLSQSPSKPDRRPIDRCRPRPPYQHPCFTISKGTTAIRAGAHNLACAPTIAHPGYPRKSVCLCAA